MLLKGLMRLVGKLFKKFVGSLGLTVCLPIVLLFRVVRPIVEIRYGFLFVDRVGHFVFDLEYYLTESVVTPKRKRHIDLFFVNGKVCNLALLEMMKRHVVVNQFVEYLFNAEKLVPGRRNLLYPARVRLGSTDHTGIFSKAPPQLNFTEAEHRQGEHYLRSVNCPANARIVCLVVRDSAYLDSIRPNRNWSYHSYRDTTLENYRSVALYLAQKGYWVFMMGKVVKQEFDVDHPRVIDYARSVNRSDFLDIWLLGRCFFAISTSTGLDSVADAFRKPIAFVNFLPLAWFQTWTHCVLAPCHLFWRSTGEELTCAEHLANSYLRAEDYEKAGIEVRELSGEEILQIVKELNSELTNGTDIYGLDREKQKEFWRLLNGTLTGALDTEIQSALPSAFRIPTATAIEVHKKAWISRTFLDQAPNFLG